jgi:hypothetical protein
MDDYKCRNTSVCGLDKGYLDSVIPYFSLKNVDELALILSSAPFPGYMESAETQGYYIPNELGRIRAFDDSVDEINRLAIQIQREPGKQKLKDIFDYYWGIIKEMAGIFDEH